MWRKGFGYAWVVTGNLNMKAQLRIQAGLYIGPGGIVEAQGMILRRPIDSIASTETIRKKSEILNLLRDFLKVKDR